MATRVTSPLPRACIALTKSEEKERLLAVYFCVGFLFIYFFMYEEREVTFSFFNFHTGWLFKKIVSVDLI